MATTEVLLRDAVFDGPSRVRALTQADGTTGEIGPRLAAVDLEEGSEQTKGNRLVLRLPPRSFTVIEVPIEMEL